jgi:CheY-like chemotaxis protein
MNGNPKRILLVDDDEDVRFLLSDLFTQEGYVTFEAADGCDALAAMKKRQPDVVLCDYHMPRMDGLAFLEISRVVWPHIPVVLASCDPELHDQAFTHRVSGAYGCLSKPFDLDELLSVVKNASMQRHESHLYHTASG